MKSSKKYAETIFAPLFFLLSSCTLSGKTGDAGQVIANEFYTLSISNKWIESIHNDDPDCIYLHKSGKEKSILLICTSQEINPALSADKKSFFLVDGEWVRGGAMNYSAAALGEPHGIPSIRGTASCGINTETGFHAAAGACTTIILFAEKYSISIETDGTEESNKYAEEIAALIKIKSPTKKTIHELLPVKDESTIEQ